MWAFLGPLKAAPVSAATWGETYFPNVPLVTQEGETVHFYNDLIKGKIVLVNFIYASCKQICPLVTARMAQVQKQLGDRVGRDIFLYSITLDPVHDTPEVLKKHANAFHIGAGWLFLTGKPEDIERVRYKLGERSKGLADHRNDAIAGNGATGEWERTSLFQDVGQIALTILNIDPVFRTEKGNTAGLSYVNVTPLHSPGQPGQALFVKACASCHTVGKGDLVGPDLQDVTARRDRGWLSRFMRMPDELRAKQDPIALALSAKYEGVSMPNLGLSETDVGDLLVYLEAETRRLAAEAAPPPHRR
jgi:protein SCO1/2